MLSHFENEQNFLFLTFFSLFDLKREFISRQSTLKRQFFEENLFDSDYSD